MSAGSYGRIYPWPIVDVMNTSPPFASSTQKARRVNTKAFLLAAGLILQSIHSFAQTGGTLEIEPYPSTVSEAVGSVRFVVQRVGDSSRTVTVDYATSDGTAKAGLDYAAASGTLIFGPGATRKTFRVIILDDGLTEPDETVNLTLSNPTGGAVLGPQKTAILTILDDERSGGLDSSFPSIGCDCFFYQLTTQADGKILVINLYGGLRRINTDGSWDSTFFVSVTRPTAMAVQPDGRILVVGQFTNINNISRPGIARLNADGSVDTTFDPGSGISPLTFQDSGDYGFNPDPWAFDSSVIALRLQTDGKILIGGGFTNVGGFGRQGLARLNPDGSVDLSFDPALEGDRSFDRLVSSLIVQPDGKLLVNGSFKKVSGVPRDGLARLNPDGSLDLSFQSVISRYPLKLLALQPDGKAVIYFEDKQFTGNGLLARLDSNGAMDSSFDTRVELVNDCCVNEC